jgi:hypothetical protein
VSDKTGSDILYNPTHFRGPLVCRIRQVLTSYTIRHISLVPWCVRLDRFHCTNFIVFGLNGVTEHNTHYLQHSRQALHTKGPRKCVGLYRMSEPVLSDTPRDHGNVTDCTGCQNLSNPTHQGTREMCRIVQDVRTCLI